MTFAQAALALAVRMRKNIPLYRLPPKADLSNPEHVETLNTILQNLGQRLDTIQQIGVKAPSAPLSVSATGKQGLIHIVWGRVANVDGYTVLWASEATMTKLVGRQSLPDGDTVSVSIPIGNSATQYWITVSAYKGNQVSKPSATVNATSVAFTTAEAAPPSPPNDPRAPLVVGIRNGTTLS